MKYASTIVAGVAGAAIFMNGLGLTFYILHYTTSLSAKPTLMISMVAGMIPAAIWMIYFDSLMAEFDSG